MKNLAGNKNSTALASVELTEAGIPTVNAAPYGEVGAAVCGVLGPFTFRRAWVYWVAEGEMSEDNAKTINDEPMSNDDHGTKYSGGRGTWGDVVRAEGFAGGQLVTRPIDCWHIDSPEGLKFFADKIRELGLA